MDWLTFTVEMTKALAWPLAIVAVFLLFRRQVLELIPALTKLKFPGGELEFDKQLMKASKQAENVLPETGLSKIIEAEGKAERKATVKGDAEALANRDRRLAELSPPASIVEAWVGLEEDLKGIAVRLDLPVNSRRNPTQIINRLVQLEKIDKQTVNMFQVLRNLRNNAAHASSSELNTDQALEYRDLIARLREKLQSLN